MTARGTECPADNPQKGVIPVNAFNNVDLYVPTMLPEGAAHLPCEQYQLVEVDRHGADGKTYSQTRALPK